MKLMVIDGNSILNRAYYGIRPLTTRDGFYTHAIFGFLTTLGRLLDEEDPQAVCVTFDRREPTFRHLRYDGYKATRHGMPEELAMQLPVMKEVLDAMQIPHYEMAGFEADDLIGTISRKCEADGWDCVIVTGDKDSLQLITEHTKVKLVSTRMGQTTTRDMTPQTFEQEYGFAPIHMIDLKALMGDSSDNLIGVPGVGETTAKALITKYHSIDAIYAALPQIEAKPNVIRKLTEGEESARETYYLATIVTDAPLDFVPGDNVRKAPSEALYPLFLKLEFHKLIEKYGLSAQKTAHTVRNEAMPEITVVHLRDEDRTDAYLAKWRSAKRVFIATTKECHALAVNCGDETALLRSDTYEGNWNALLKMIFSADIAKVSHNVKDLMRTLLEQNLPIGNFVFDTALAAYLLDATAGSFDLDKVYISCFQEALPAPAHEEKDAFLPLGDSAAAEQSLCAYAAAIGRLYGVLASEIETRDCHFLYYEAELPLCCVLARMEQKGMQVDAAALRRFGEELDAELKELEGKIYEQSGGAFNINSPKQLGEVLFEKLHLPHGKKTKTGWSTNADVLEKLRAEAPIVEDVLQYRQYAKFKSTYCEGLLKVIAPDGRIHTSFQMTATATGRLSSTEPNLQNIPTRTRLGSEFRRMFVPQKGSILVDADYSQIELRLLSHIADDETMQNAFCTGEDIHTVTASEVFGVPREAVTREMRSRAKAVNFGIVYGISAFSLAQDIGVAVYEAKEYIESYFSRFSGIHRYMTEVVEKAKKDGFVETLYHRRRALPELTASNFATRSFGERVALNMPVQGTAADIMKLAMVRVDARLARENLQGRLVLQVHDELIVECPNDEAERVSRILAEEMEQAVSLRVPLTADAHFGKTWLEAKG